MSPHPLFGGATTLPPQIIWIVMALAFGASGATMLVFARPFESLGRRHPTWILGSRPRSARFYRVVGALWLLIGIAMATPAVLVGMRLHA